MTRRSRWIITAITVTALPMIGCVSNPFAKSSMISAAPTPAGTAILASNEPPIKDGELSKQERATAALSIAQGLEARLATMREDDPEQRSQKQKAEKDCIAHYEMARQLNPKLAPEASKRLALMYDRRGDTPKAMAEYSQMLKADPKNAEVWNDLGYCHFQRSAAVGGDQSILLEAEKCFRHATELKPDYEKAWINLGMTLGQLDRNDDALAAFQKVNRPAEAYVNLGFVLVTQGRHGEAREAYRQAVALEAGIKLPNGTPIALVIDKMDGKLPAPPPEAKQPKDWKGNIAFHKDQYLAKRRAEREGQPQTSAGVDLGVSMQPPVTQVRASAFDVTPVTANESVTSPPEAKPTRNLPATKPVTIPLPK